MTSTTNLHPSTRRAVIRRLDEAASLIEQGWTRGAYARDADGEAVNPLSTKATCWCLRGALTRAFGDMASPTPFLVRLKMEETARDLYDSTPIDINDKIARDRRTPLRVLRETKKRLEAQA